MTVRKIPVDFLYRDINKVSKVIGQCLNGEVTIDYQPGHPHAFISCIYMSEVALCKVLWDPHGSISSLKNKTLPYPKALKKALISKFLWEANFAWVLVSKNISRQDASHFAGCCFRSISCLNQALFAINEIYWMNEKGAIHLADNFSLAPERYKERINELFSLLSDETEKMKKASDACPRN